MNLLADRLYFGVTPRLLVHAVQRLASQHTFGEEEAAEALGAPVEEIRPVLKEMSDAGYVIMDGLVYRGTERFNQLANAKLGPGVPRAEAESLLHSVIAKAAEINANEAEFGATIQCVVVFGSYLTDKEVLGDLDLGVEVREGKRDQESIRKILDDLASGRTPSARIYRALRLRQPNKISIHALREVLELGTPFQVVFGYLAQE